MNSALKNLVQKLSDLDKKAEEFDRGLIALRIEISDMLWDLVELKKRKNEKKDK